MASSLRSVALPLLLLLLLLLTPACGVDASEDVDVDQTCSANDEGCSSDNHNNHNNNNNDSDCVDEHFKCAEWASAGECTNNPTYMLKSCAKSCEACKTFVENDWGVAQEVSGSRALEVRAVLDKTQQYMQQRVFKDAKFDSVRSECRNRHALCAFWAVLGECEANPQYMALHCAPSCQSCELISFETRCPYDPNAPTALQPGDLNRLFERLATEPYYQQYEPHVYSQPTPTSPDIRAGPWVVTLDNFVTPEECERIIELGAAEGYSRSSDVGSVKFDGTFDSYENSGRTSTNAWCVKSCYEDPLVQTLLARMVNVTGVPEANYEYLQMLRYEVGQFYQEHHDYIPHHLERSEGVRILTVYLYLNEPEAGGGTNFPRLGNITVMPKAGKVLIWPSVLNEDPNKKDPRTQHQALPVEAGVKYGANAWIHQRDFKEPYSRSCH